MRELQRPSGIEGDERATEMIRVWIANKGLHVTLLLGMWADAKDSEVDERDAWGELLVDLTKHIANGMMQDHGWDYDSTRERIRASFLKHYDLKDRRIEGSYPDDQ